MSDRDSRAPPAAGNPVEQVGTVTDRILVAKLMVWPVGRDAHFSPSPQVIAAGDPKTSTLGFSCHEVYGPNFKLKLRLRVISSILNLTYENGLMDAAVP